MGFMVHITTHFLKKVYLFLFYDVWVFCLHMFAIFECSSHRGQKRVSDLLELQLERVGVSVGSGRTAGALNH